MPVDVTMSGRYQSVSATEAVLAQWSADLGLFGASPTVPVAMSGIVKATGGAMGRTRLRIGGTDGVADGTQVLEITTTSASEVNSRVTGTMANPGTQVLVKVCGLVSAPPETADVRGSVVRFG